MSIKGTNQNRRLSSVDFDTCTPIEGEIVFNNVTNVIKSKVNTKCAFYHPTCSVIQYGNAVPLGCFTPTLQAVCSFVDTRTTNLMSMPTINSVATNIPVFS